MDTAFLDKAISTNLINKKITSVDDLYQMNMSILMNRNGFSSLSNGLCAGAVDRGTLSMAYIH